jgi:hypothetical protein
VLPSNLTHAPPRTRAAGRSDLAVLRNGSVAAVPLVGDPSVFAPAALTWNAFWSKARGRAGARADELHRCNARRPRARRRLDGATLHT